MLAKTFHFRFMTSKSSFMLVHVKHHAKCIAFVFFIYMCIIFQMRLLALLVVAFTRQIFSVNSSDRTAHFWG